MCTGIREQFAFSLALIDLDLYVQEVLVVLSAYYLT
jgi:hypothetical protein